MNKKRPNVIVFMSDQQRYDTLGCTGNPVIQTPNLDRLAQEGIRFDRSYASSPVCMPSRAAVLTGRYPKNCGAWHVGVPLPESEPTAADYFKSAGYSTVAIGKMHLTNFHQMSDQGSGHIESVHRNKGFEPEYVDNFWRNFNGPYFGFEKIRLVLQHGNRTVGGGHYDLWLRDNHPDAVDLLDPEHALTPLTGAMQSWKASMPKELHFSNWIADETVEYLNEHTREHAEQPFFMLCSFPDPHHPMCPPAPYCDMYNPKDVPIPVPNRGELENMPPHHQKYYRGEVIETRLNMASHIYKTRGIAGTVGGDYPLCDMPEEHLREMIAHYYGLITLMDEAIGRILKTLDQLGLSDDTIIVFNSDHGDLMGDHGLAFKGPFHYESIVKIPTIWRWPGHIQPNEATNALMSHVDVVPTLLDACDIDIPAGVQGVSQLPVLKGQTDTCRSWALVEHRENVGELQTKTLVTDRYKLTYYPAEPYGELFDLVADPKEYNNLWNSPKHHDLQSQLVKQLLEVQCLTEDPLPERIGYA